MAVVHPTEDDPVARALSEGIGGPRGVHARGHRWWTPVRLLLALTALTFALGMVQKSGCFADTWEDGTARYTQMCYSDLPYLYTARGFAELNWPFSSDPQVRARYEVMEYPVGIAYWAYGAAWVTHWLNGSPSLDERYVAPVESLWGMPDVHREIRLYVVVNAIGFAVLALLSTWLLAGVRRDRPWDAAGFALAPTLLAAGLVNWDLVAVVCVAGALFAWSRDRPGWTGVMIGLGTAAKLYPLFLLGGVLVLAWRSRRWASFGRALAGAVVTWGLVNLPAYLSGPDQWKVFWSFNSGRTADLGSLWLVASDVFHTTFDAPTINHWSWLLFIAWCAAVLAAGVRARRTPTLAELGLLIVTGFLLVNKVYSPQYVLWLLPFAVLARPRWRDQLVWQGAELVYFAAVWWYLGGFLTSGRGDSHPVYDLAVLVRVAGQLFLVALVVRSWFPRVSGAAAVGGEPSTDDAGRMVDESPLVGAAVGR
ncbi:glycosyltransferase 87 family protein [Nocardioides sp. CER19]|uniref:glycosyltransferase family 87 protein n=1 Tax=Nocardioides sp. CER19 TaxID=3038538 RepID=UPI00244A6C95|nr:glycosyltransferase 87 family protein [Nocardioides sp. CER19]MDH2412818.1 glycosyltransferase 87 family protein [Nocardioides sp. CER19]